MLFDTPAYLLFLVLVVLAYWCLGWRGQNRFLLAASSFFYAWWDWRFLLLMFTSATVDYHFGQIIADSRRFGLRRSLLIASLVLNFGFLGVFKYYNFFAQSLANALASVGFQGLSLPFLEIILPPGISFYTFQEVAYIIDIYFCKQQPARRFVDYALFICLFPHLIAGPIQKPSHLLPQVQRPRCFDPRRFFDGIMLILLGLFRKTVIADNSAILANAAFGGRLGHTAFATLTGVFAFALQIYGDFSGYSDIARGSAQLLGFHFIVNFRQPYLAESLQDFWRRWHISLSRWLRDYLYIPLGGNRRSRVRTYANLMTTMLLGGLWHGANWTFVVWGGLHGCWLSIEKVLWGDEKRTGARSAFHVARWAVTMGVVGLSWLFFRAQSVGMAIAMLGDLRVLVWQNRYGPLLAYLGILALVAVVVDIRLELWDEEYPFEKARPAYATAVMAMMAIVMVAFGAMETNAFIYFQF
jgi:D-alanyl-lipoteichoic acid acyltransferase DltB (MBOAT superfamily)